MIKLYIKCNMSWICPLSSFKKKNHIWIKVVTSGLIYKIYIDAVCCEQPRIKQEDNREQKVLRQIPV